MSSATAMGNEDDPTLPLLYPSRSVGAGVVASAAPPLPPLPKPLSAPQALAITVFSIIRILRGILFMVIPSLALSSFNIPTTGVTFLLGAFVGSRDLLLGGLLATSTPFLCREVHRALLVNLLSDTADTLILIFSAACAWHTRAPVVEIVGLALLAISEHLTLFSMSEDDEDEDEGGYGGVGGRGKRGGSTMYQRMLQADEDKRNRLDSWLGEMRRVEEVRMMNGSPKPSSTIRG